MDSTNGPLGPSDDRYVLPTTSAQLRVFATMNTVVTWLTAHGVSVAGSRVLAVRGRSSGQWRTTPVNVMTIEGRRYLLAPRGHTQWVRNLRAAGGGELRVGHRTEAFTAREVADADKPPLMREYLRRWAWEVKQFFENLDKASSDADLLAAAPGFPVFEIEPTTREAASA